MGNKRYIVRAPNGVQYAVVGREGLSRREVIAAVVSQNPDAGVRTYQVRANDGNNYEVRGRPGLSQTQVRNAVHAERPETNVRRNAIGAGFAQARNNLTTGLPFAFETATGRLTEEEQQRYLASQREAMALAEQRLPGGAPSFDDMMSGRADFFGGLMENLGQSVPQAVPAAIGAIGGGIGGAAMGSAAGPGGTIAGGIGGVLGGVGASTPFFIGSNVNRATEGGQVPLTQSAARRAIAAAPAQAGADVLAAKFIPGIGRVFRGPVVNTSLARLARPGLARGAVRVGQGAVAGGTAEAGQQLGERYAAGLPLGDAEAMREYGESAALGALMDASVGVAGAPFSGRRDGSTPTPTPTPAPSAATAANAAGTVTPPDATDFGTEEDTAALTKEVEKLAPEQKAVFASEYTRLIEDGLTSEVTAATMALDVAKRVPVTTTQGAEDVVSVGPDGAGSVPSFDPRGGVEGTPEGTEGTPAGDVGVSGSPAAVNVQGEGDVNAPLTTAAPKRRKGKAAAPVAEGENLAAAAAAELATPVTQAPTAPTVEAEAPTPAPAPAATPTPSEVPGAGFKTAMGSTYTVDEEGRTTRTKAERDTPGHEGDFGRKPTSAKTVYVDSPEKAAALSAAGLQGLGKQGARVVVKDGKATLLTWNQKENRWGSTPSSRGIPVYSEPTVGRAPLELWGPAKDVPGYEAYRKMHAGNQITELFGSAPEAAAPAPEAAAPTPTPSENVPDYIVENARGTVDALRRSRPDVLARVTDLHADDFTAGEIAQQTGLSPETVRDVRLGLGLPGQGKPSGSIMATASVGSVQERAEFEAWRDNYKTTGQVTPAPKKAFLPVDPKEAVFQAAQLEGKTAVRPPMFAAYMRGVNEVLGRVPVASAAAINRNVLEYREAYAKGKAFATEALKAGSATAEAKNKPTRPVLTLKPKAAEAVKAAPSVRPHVAKAAAGIRAAQKQLAGAPLEVKKVAAKAVDGEFKVELNDGTEVGLYFDRQSGNWLIADPLVATNDITYGADNTLGTNKKDAVARLPDTVARARAATLALEQKASAKPTPAAPKPAAEAKVAKPAAEAKTAKPKPKAEVEAGDVSVDAIELVLEVEDRVALAKHFGFPTYSKQVRDAFYEVVVKAASKGLRSVDKAIRAIVEKALTAALAVGLIFNPMTLDLPNVAVKLARVEAAVAQRAPLPEGAANYMTPDAAAVYQRVAPVAKDASTGFIIVDKPAGEIHLFRDDGSHIASTPALSGASQLDEMSAERKQSGDLAVAVAEPVTRAGTFTTQKDVSSNMDGWVLRLNDADGQNYMVSMHATVLTDRQAALDSETRTDNAITLGCVTMDKDFFRDTVQANIDQFDDNLVFVMPHDAAKAAELFPGKEGTVVIQAGGVQEQLRETPRRDDLPMAPPKQKAQERAQAQRRTGGGKKRVTPGKKKAAAPPAAPKAKKTPAAPATPLTPADRAAARSLEETKAVVTEAARKFNANNIVKNPGTAADTNQKANDINTAMPFLEKAWRTMSAPSFKKWLEVMPLSRMAEWGDKNVPGLTKLYHLGTQKIGQLHTYQRRFNDITKQLVGVANKYGKEVLAEVAYYTRINRVDVTELGDTLADSYNADRPLQWYAKELGKQNVSAARRKRLDKAALRREKEIKEVYDRWQLLGEQKGGREAFLATQKFYKTMYNALRALNYSAMRRLNVSEQTQKELKDTFDAALEGELEEDTGMPRNLYPREYVPAKRFGEFWLDIAADTSKDNKRERIFKVYDTAGERDAELRRFSNTYGINKRGEDAGGTRVVSVGNSMKALQEVPDVRGTMLEKLYSVLDRVAEEGADLPNKKQVDALKKELFSAWLMSSSANSLQKNFAETKELVAGFSLDIPRVFADSAMQYASLLSSAEYDHKIANQIEKLRGDIEERHAPDDQSRYLMFVDEMENRLVQDYAAQNEPNVFNSINRAMFFYFLTAPATAAAQWVSLPGVVVPVLGAEYGYGKTTAAFTKYLNFAKTLGVTETNALGETVLSMSSMRNSDSFKNDPLFRKAYLAGAGRAVFETMVDVVTSSAATPTRARTKGEYVKNAALKTNEVITGVLSAVYTSSELVTREVAYMTAFDLHYAKTGNFEASVNAAVTNVNKSMGSYLDIERPAFMKHSAIRSLMAFKQYAIAMTSLYVDSIVKILPSLPDGNPYSAKRHAERMMAIKQLAGITTMGALLGGVPGTMVFGIIGSTFGTAMKAALDDEEKEAIRAEDPLVNPLDNFEAWFRRKWLPDTFGTGLGDIVENGVISELTGADFASRLSNSNMWWRDGKPGETPSQNILNTAAANIPPLSMAMSVADAYGDFSEGRVLRGAAKIAPAFLRGGINAYRINKEGIESPTTGDTSIAPGELSMADIASQALGFVPMKVSDFRKESFAFQGARTEAGRAKTRAMGNLYRVLTDANAQPGQLDRAIAAIERHNLRYPPGTPYFIDEKTLQKSLDRQEDSDERTYRGMMLREEEARFAPTYEGDR